MADERFNIRVGVLKPETEKLAEQELRETPEVREAAIAELRELLHAATDLHYRDDDEFLLIILRACHFYPQSAIEKLRKIAEFRKDNAALLKGLMPEDEKKSFCEHNAVNVLANCDDKGRRVLLVNVGKVWNPRDVTTDSIFRMFYLIHIAAQLEPETQVRGVVVIMDFEGLGLKQATSFSLSFSRRLLTFIQEAMPIRLKEVHIVKQPGLFKIVWKVFSPLVKEKLRNRMSFHGDNMSTLHEFIDPEYLPENYGGKLPKINYSGKEWFPAIMKHQDFVREWSEFGYANQ